MKPPTYDAYEDAALIGARVLKEVLETGDTDESALRKGRMAAMSMAAFAKIYQASSARESTVVSIITHAAPDAEEFRRLIVAALPGTPVTKALEGPKRSAAQSSAA